MADLRLTRPDEVDATNPVAGDLHVEDRAFGLVTGIDAIRQELEVEYRWWLGEWFADASRGVPYVEQLYRKGIAQATILAILKRVALRVPGVKRVLSIELTQDTTTRYATGHIVVQTDSGQIRAEV